MLVRGGVAKSGGKKQVSRRKQQGTEWIGRTLPCLVLLFASKVEWEPTQWGIHLLSISYAKEVYEADLIIADQKTIDDDN